MGDALFVTGSLGGPAAALAAWQGGREPAADARQRFAHPSARIREARWLGDKGARAMIDVSDGLIADARHLAAASDVRCVIEMDSLPLHAGAQPAMAESALVGGEEFELLVALEDDDTLAAAFAQEFDLPLTRIGRMESGSGVIVMRDGEVVSDLEVFRHF